MRIAIIDADPIGRRNHRFANLASIKLAGCHKERGDDVELINDYSLFFDAGGTAGHLLCDRVYLSKVFTEPPVPPGFLSNSAVSCGCVGFFYANAPPNGQQPLSQLRHSTRCRVLSRRAMPGERRSTL
jgi:hypothetical protein